jgi:hypothetical protein
MTVIKDLYNAFFGKDYELVWQQFASENNAQFTESNSVEVLHEGYKIVFDTYTHYSVVGGSSYETEYTRVKAEFISPDNILFRLTKQGFVDTIGKAFGAQDIEIGDKAFDKRFMIKTNDEYKVQSLFSVDIIKHLILSQRDIHLEIIQHQGIFEEPVKEGYSMLYYISETVVKEKEQLESLLKLYSALLTQLTKLRSAKV